MTLTQEKIRRTAYNFSNHAGVPIIEVAPSTLGDLGPEYDDMVFVERIDDQGHPALNADFGLYSLRSGIAYTFAPSYDTDLVLEQALADDIAYAAGTLKPQVGDICSHYRGGRYEVLSLALSHESLVETVVYRSVFNDQVWVQSLDEFTETVEVDGRTRSRFVVIHRHLA